MCWEPSPHFLNCFVETLGKAKIKPICILTLMRLQVWWCHNAFLSELSPVFISMSVNCFNCHFIMFVDDWMFIYIREGHLRVNPLTHPCYRCLHIQIGDNDIRSLLLTGGSIKNICVLTYRRLPVTVDILLVLRYRYYYIISSILPSWWVNMTCEIEQHWKIIDV